MRALIDAESLQSQIEATESKRFPAFDLFDASLNRYLQAREFDITKAFEMLRATIQWRLEQHVGKILEDPESAGLVREQNALGKNIVPKFRSRDGHAVLLLNPSKENSKDGPRMFRNLIYNCERVVSSSAQVNFVLMIDFKGYSMFNAPSFRLTL